jgi:hypothetical protein
VAWRSLVSDLCFAIVKTRQPTTTHESLAFLSYWFRVWWDEKNIIVAYVMFNIITSWRTANMWRKSTVCVYVCLCVCVCVFEVLKRSTVNAAGIRLLLPPSFHSVLHNTVLKRDRHFRYHSKCNFDTDTLHHTPYTVHHTPYTIHHVQIRIHGYLYFASTSSFQFIS